MAELEGSGRGRGRVVMLVHTAVGPDSRVTKQARSMSERGWDVILLAPSEVSYPVDIGNARVRVVDVKKLLQPQRHLYRTPRARDPLAYTSGSKGRYLARLADAKVGDLYFRIDAIRTAASPPPMAGPRVIVLRGRLAIWRLRRRWSDFRYRRMRALATQRQEMRSWCDRASTAMWTRLLGKRAWRRLWPGAWEQEMAYGPKLDRLQPDLIHANDFMMLAVAARAKVRAKAAGRSTAVVWDAREYLPGMSPWMLHPRWKPAHVALEREFAPYADAVVTVSEPLADMLVEDFDLDRPPVVVLNAPVVPGAPCGRRLREDCGIDASTPLVVYSGGAAPQRGLEVMIEALPDLPGVHTAFVVLPPNATSPGSYMTQLLERADELGVGDRVHVLHYVPSEEVVTYLADADLGVFPGLPFLNHTISLITKFLEYSQARLPIVVSNLKTMAETVRATGQGEVFEPEDVPTYVTAVSRILASPREYRAAYDDAELMASWDWERQAVLLDQVYAELAQPSRRAR